ncbi:MAG: glycosyltransferase family 4 protein [Candidatus Promineifilaceae bacterium]
MDVELLCKRQRGMSGIGRYAQALSVELTHANITHRIAHPKQPAVLKPISAIGRTAGYDLGAFLQTYPLSADFSQPGTLKHLVSQEMGTWLTLHRRTRTIVTVHDILPQTLTGHLAELHHPLQRLFYRLAMRGLRFASHLIADSQYTKMEVVRELGIAPEQITVVPLAVDHAVFRPIDTPRPANLPPNYLLYVGSDAPRKNLPRLLEAFATVRRHHPELWLVKVGAATSVAQAAVFEQQVAALDLQKHVLMLTDVSAEKLVACYNHATAFVFPSLYEGFGLPPLEAMACGTPVICANATALPEVVGEAALLVDGRDSAEIADAILSLLANPALAATLRERGLQRAQQFHWRQTARKTAALYKQY